jgi:hypothetical protein
MHTYMLINIFNTYIDSKTFKVTTINLTLNILPLELKLMSFGLFMVGLAMLIEDDLKLHINLASTIINIHLLYIQ